jgi:hypothetical protein
MRQSTHQKSRYPAATTWRSDAEEYQERNAIYVEEYWDTFVRVLMTAGAFYAFVIQRFEQHPIAN